jgi:hypothetical protein
MQCKKKIKLLFIVMLLLLIPILSQADTIYLNDGSVIIGEIIEISETLVIIKTTNGILEINKDDITKIEFEPVVDNSTEPQDDEIDRDEVIDELEDLIKDDSNTIIIIIKTENEDEQENDIEENTETNDEEDSINENETDDNDNDDFNWDDENETDDNDNDDFNWDNENETDDNDNDDFNWDDDTGYRQGYRNNWDFSLGFISVLDFFSGIGEPYFVWGISARMINFDSPFSFNFGFNMGHNVIIDYYTNSTTYTLIAEYWGIYSIGAEFRLLYKSSNINPYIGASLSFHHLYMPFATLADNYGALALTLTGGVEFFFFRFLSIQLYLRKHISLGLEDLTFGLYYDQSFYDALFENFQFGATFYLNFSL